MSSTAGLSMTAIGEGIAVFLGVLFEIFFRPLQTLYLYALAGDWMAMAVLGSMVALTVVVLYYMVSGNRRVGEPGG